MSEVWVATTWFFVGRDSRTAEQWTPRPPPGGLCFLWLAFGAAPDDRDLTLRTHDPSLLPPTPLSWAFAWLPLDYLTHNLISHCPTPPDTTTPKRAPRE